MSGSVHIVDHPLVQHKVAILRDINTEAKDFRELLEEVTMLMSYEVTSDFPTEEVDIQTPISKGKVKMLCNMKIALVPVLRAGLGMTNVMLRLLPNAKVGHIGFYRDEVSLQPIQYFCKLPSDIIERDIILIDPMLATGNTAVASLNLLKQRGAKKIRMMCLLAAPEGIENVQSKHPDVDIYVAGVDIKLNSIGYMIPGLGDAGDRMFGTI